MSNGPRYRGKTFHEYMSAKFWHPASKRNIVTVWKRKEQMKVEKRKHEERAEESRRENEKHMVQSALGDKKAKLGVAFLYDMPNNIMPRDINAPENQGDLPGMTAKNFEIKFDWQKNAPRDSHFNGMGEVRNSIFNHKPFGIEVRNVKCLKCGAWGHSNFDRTCPLFGKVADRDNPEFDLKREQLEMLSSRLKESSNQSFKMKQSIIDGYNIGDTMFDPLEKKKKEKVKVPEMEFLKTLEPAEKEALLKSLEKQRKKRKKQDKVEKAKAKAELKAEIAKVTETPKIEVPDIKQEQKSDSDDEVDVKPFVDIVLPKRKDEIEAEKNAAAKKAFARQLASLYATMKKDESSDSSDTDSSESDSSDDDSDYETNTPSPDMPGSSKSIVDPSRVKGKVAPAPKKGMVLVRKKKTNQAEIKANEEMEKKKKMLAYTQALRKKMSQLQAAEAKKATEKASAKKKPVAHIVTDEDMTSGLLDVTKTWNKVPVVNYGSSSDEE